MSSRSGFSLLELLVALALLAVIGAGLAGAMRLGVETYSRAQALEDDSLGATRTQLRHLMSRATPPNLLTPFPKDFKGTESSLSFVTLAPMGFARDAAGLKVTIAEHGENFDVTIEPFDDDGAILRQYKVLLAQGVSDVTFRYFDDGEWTDSWSGKPILPQLVQIDMADDDEIFWPEFTVELIYRD